MARSNAFSLEFVGIMLDKVYSRFNARICNRRNVLKSNNWAENKDVDMWKILRGDIDERSKADCR